MLKPAVADIEKNGGVEVGRITCKGHGGHNPNPNPFQVKVAGQLQRKRCPRAASLSGGASA
jgi:hypothetical protein